MDHINQNNCYTKSFELYESDGRTPLDCSGLTVKFIVKKSKAQDDGKAVLAREYVNPATNILLFEWTAAETARIEPGEYISALKIYRENGMNEEVWTGRVSVEKGVFNG